MLEPDVLKALCPVLFTPAKLTSYYAKYIHTVLVPKWTSELERLSTLIDFRDFAEDTFAVLMASFCIETTPSVPIDNLVKALKLTTDFAKRRIITRAYIEENVLGLTSKIGSSLNADFTLFAIDLELVTYFDLAFGLGKIRPVLKCSVETIESVVKRVDLQKSITLETLESFAKDLGVSSLWPVVALLKAHKDGDLEELFLHVPLPKVFGAPSCIRNSVVRNGLVQIVGATGLLIDKAVIASKNSLCWKTLQGWTTKECSVATLVAVLPGTKFVWCHDPDTLKAAIYELNPFKVIVEFELPGDEAKTNWIDCQRDAEGTLVLMWGHINPLTGALLHQNVSGINEDELLTDSASIMCDVSEIPMRRRLGYKVDWRDHGNLISIHHKVLDIPGLERKWSHNYDIVYADNILMTLETEARPIEAVFGSPREMLLLSPLSAMQSLQMWTIKDGKYGLSEYSRLPKCAYGHWTSLTAILK